MRGEEDFFSVARTIPFVALRGLAKHHIHDNKSCTFDTERSNALVHGI